MIKQDFIYNSAGERLFVEYYIPEKVKSTILFCHGITGCRKGRTKDDNYFQVLAKRLMNLNYKVVLFDFSGHGDSEGNDFDVSLSKSTDELETVFKNSVADQKNVNFLAFSYGATVLCNFLQKHEDISPLSMVLYSPCLYPLESCFLNSNSIFGKDIVREYQSGSMDKNGFAVVGAKNFRFSKKMIVDCEGFSPDYLSKFSKNTLVISGKKDVILNTKYNDDFCKKYGIEEVYLDTSHALFEDIDKAFELTISHFEKFCGTSNL